MMKKDDPDRARDLDLDLGASATVLEEAIGEALDEGLRKLELLGDASFRQMMASLRITDMRYADLSGLDLRGEDLSLIDFEGAVFEGTDLRDCDFTGANLRNAVLIGARLDGASFRDANLEGTQVESVISMTVHPRPR